MSLSPNPSQAYDTQLGIDMNDIVDLDIELSYEIIGEILIPTTRIIFDMVSYDQEVDDQFVYLDTLRDGLRAMKIGGNRTIMMPWAVLYGYNDTLLYKVHVYGILTSTTTEESSESVSVFVGGETINLIQTTTQINTINPIQTITHIETHHVSTPIRSVGLILFVIVSLVGYLAIKKINPVKDIQRQTKIDRLVRQKTKQNGEDVVRNQLVKSCLSCGADNPGDSNFCMGCGVKL